jgi:uncharacterized membrane protein
VEFFWSHVVAHSWSVLLGGAAGYAFYRFVGCKTGVCPITANPWISTLYGALIGVLLSR